MNWPDPGTPPEHGTDEQTDSDAPEDQTPTSEGADEPATAGDEELDPTSGYARLRSEADDDLGRWEAPEPPPVSDPDEPVPGLDPAGPDRADSSALDVGVAADSSMSSPAAAGTGSVDADVSSDEVCDEVAGGRTEADATGGAPGRTREDGLSDDVPATEASGFGRPSFSPHTGSWAAGSSAPAGSETGVSDGTVEEPSAASGHAEGERELPAPDAPGGLASASDGPVVSPGGAPDGPPFHGERDGPEAAVPDDDAMFHGERPAETPATAGLGEVPRSSSAAAIEDALSELDEGDRHATVICVANQKGGVGKTTTTVSLGAALAMLGAQVLVVDLDPQGNATTGLGLRAQEGAPSTYRVIVEQMDVEDAAEPTAVRGLHVLPSSLDLAGAEIELVPAFSRENRLKQALDAVRDLYDVILIDCPPSLGLLTINALVAADQVLVPIQCEYYALEGLGQLMRTVKLVADSLNRGLGVGGVVLTMFDGRTNLSQQVVDEVQNYFGDIAYQTIVPRTVRLSEAPSYGQPIGVFDAASRGARAYQRLAREVARRLDLDLEEEDVSPLDRLLGSTAPPPDEAAPLPTDLVPEDVPTHTDSGGADDAPGGERGHPEEGDQGDREDTSDHVQDQHDGSEHRDHHDEGHADGHGEHAYGHDGSHGRDEGQPHDHGHHEGHDQHEGDHGHDGDHGQHDGHHGDHGQHDGQHEGHGQHGDHGQHEGHHGDHGHGDEQHGHHDEGHHQHDEPGHGTEGWT